VRSSFNVNNQVREVAKIFWKYYKPYKFVLLVTCMF
jgi:hypothetical protein